MYKSVMRSTAARPNIAESLLEPNTPLFACKLFPILPPRMGRSSDKGLTASERPRRGPLRGSVRATLRGGLLEK